VLLFEAGAARIAPRGVVARRSRRRTCHADCCADSGDVQPRREDGKRLAADVQAAR
jgi:hypothetical protein